MYCRFVRVDTGRPVPRIIGLEKFFKIWFDYHYSKEELDPWVPKVKDLARKVKKVVGYFNNHYHGYAPENALYLIERLGLLSERQGQVKARTAEKQSNLTNFFGT